VAKFNIKNKELNSAMIT